MVYQGGLSSDNAVEKPADEDSEETTVSKVVKKTKTTKVVSSTEGQTIYAYTLLLTLL